MGTGTDAGLEKLVMKLFETFDRLDLDGISSLMSEEVQGVDEISRKWMRGRDSLKGYFDQLQTMGLTGVKSALSDLHTKTWGDVGVVTCFLEQRYTAEGQPTVIHAPTTILAKREGGEWKVTLVHAVPLPEDPN